VWHFFPAKYSKKNVPGRIKVFTMGWANEKLGFYTFAGVYRVCIRYYFICSVLYLSISTAII